MELVILARDGVINRRQSEAIVTPEAWEPLPGSLEAVARLSHAGRRVVVIADDLGPRQREMDVEALNRVHEKMYRMLAEVGASIEAVFFCPHRTRQRCECRPPRPGLLNDIAHRLHVSLEGVPVVGATTEVLAAALAVGARPMLVRSTDPAAAADPEHAECESYVDLASATEAILGDAAPAQPLLRAR